jgi:hypothetical protein
VADGARQRPEAMRQPGELRRRLATAEEALAHALAAMKQAGEAFDAAIGRNAARDRFDAAKNAIDTAGAAPAGGRKERPTPGRRTSGPVATWTGSSCGSTSCPSGWTGCQSSRGTRQPMD